MRKTNRMIIYFWLSAAFMLLMSTTFLIMPVAVDKAEQNRAIVVVVGLLFWLSALAGYGFVIAANYMRKKIMNMMSNSSSLHTGRMGLLSFFSNIYASVADTAMILSFVLFVAINFTEYKTSFLAYILLFLLIFSLHMHSMLNGKIFKLIQASKNIKNVRRSSSHE